MKIANYLINTLKVLSIGFLFSGQMNAQETAPAEDHSYKPLTLKLNDSGTKFIRFITWHQIWATATQNNPGTKDLNGNLIDGSNGNKAWSTDIAIRRSRFLAMAQVSPRCLIVTHWGINNQSFTQGGSAGTVGENNSGKKPQLYIHDAWTEFRIVPQKLYLGAGLHYWNGVSRLTSNSTLNFMTLDAPIFNWTNIEGTDQFARQLGIYAKGQLGKLDYRLAVNHPFVSGKKPADIAKGQAATVYNENYSFAGYIDWQFWDKESNTLPYFVGSYLGAKKVFNIGAGFYSHSKSSLYKTDTDSLYQDQLAVGVDAFLDMPLNKDKGTALNVLATFYYMNYGTNFIRNIGILNDHPTAAATESYAGGGNLQPTIGTGNIIYLQAGYLLPKLKNGTSFMPYGTFTYKNFEKIGKSSSQFALGLNYFVTGHNAKVTLEYATRPVYKLNGTAIESNGSKSQITLQTHIFL